VTDWKDATEPDDAEDIGDSEEADEAATATDPLAVLAVGDSETATDDETETLAVDVDDIGDNESDAEDDTDNRDCDEPVSASNEPVDAAAIETVPEEAVDAANNVDEEDA